MSELRRDTLNIFVTLFTGVNREMSFNKTKPAETILILVDDKEKVNEILKD
jgi:hypothetical protein